MNRYLPPGSSDFPAFTPAEAGTQFIDPGVMQGWVDLGPKRMLESKNTVVLSQKVKT